MTKKEIIDFLMRDDVEFSGEADIRMDKPESILMGFEKGRTVLSHKENIEFTFSFTCKKDLGCFVETESGEQFKINGGGESA